MPICTAWGRIGERIPETWSYGEGSIAPEMTQSPLPAGRRSDLPEYKNWNPKDNVQETVNNKAPLAPMVPLHRWEGTGNIDDEIRYFNGLKKNGIPHTPEVPVAPGKVWRYRGLPYYLERQNARFRTTPMQIKRAQENKEAHRASAVLGQLSEQLIKRSVGGKIDLMPTEAAQIDAALGQCENEVTRLHLIAASLAQAVDEARVAYGLSPIIRSFEVLCDLDERSDPQTNGKTHS